MKDTICSAFDQITMSAECENHIQSAMHQNKRRAGIRPNYLRISAAAACLMAFVLLLGSPTVVEALENAITAALGKTVEISEETTVISYESPDGKFQVEDVYDSAGNLIIGHGGNNLTVTPEWYTEQDDRVYFTGNGEFIDVTDLIDLDTPYTYTYTDQNGFIHYICIGGVYDPDPEVSNVGYAEWYYDPNYVYANGIEGRWVGGYCDNYWDKDTGTDWLWLQKAKQEMGIPWGSFTTTPPEESGT